MKNSFHWVGVLKGNSENEEEKGDHQNQGLRAGRKVAGEKRNEGRQKVGG